VIDGGREGPRSARMHESSKSGIAKRMDGWVVRRSADAPPINIVVARMMIAEGWR